MPRVCIVNGCERPHHALGYCSGHHKRLRAGNELEGPFVRSPEYRRAPCSVEGCGRTSASHGLCNGHYARLRKGSPIGGPIRKETFWEKVDTSGGLDTCWSFTGARDPLGYGRISRKTYGETMAHRYVIRLAGLEPGEAVMHECDNPPCCNPLHLTPADRLRNNQQAWERGLHPRGQGHGQARLSDDDVAEIRKLVTNGQKQTAVANRFGIAPSHVSRIVRGKARRAESSAQI